jgi:hypothetical protein
MLIMTSLACGSARAQELSGPAPVLSEPQQLNAPDAAPIGSGSIQGRVVSTQSIVVQPEAVQPVAHSDGCACGHTSSCCETQCCKTKKCKSKKCKNKGCKGGKGCKGERCSASPLCPFGDLYPHFPYEAMPRTYYYFRPYNYTHVRQQQADAMQWGASPGQPYANQAFENVYRNFEAGGETNELLPSPGTVTPPPATP